MTFRRQDPCARFVRIRERNRVGLGQALLAVDKPSQGFQLLRSAHALLLRSLQFDRQFLEIDLAVLLELRHTLLFQGLQFLQIGDRDCDQGLGLTELGKRGLLLTAVGLAVLHMHDPTLAADPIAGLGQDAPDLAIDRRGRQVDPGDHRRVADQG